jgi:hypothetical protein
MVLPIEPEILGQTSFHSELSNEPDSRLLEGSKLEPELEKSEESNEDGALEVVM